MTIHELDDATVRKIAAGEVVERPASVVKELVENSLDAGASRVDVAVDAGGTERIRVADDGRGMGPEELRVAVREHTTSKITDAGDIDAGVATLGFRGEALHAIGAVSRLSITSKPRGDRADAGRATEIRVEGGEVVEVSPAGRPAGTTVEVRDLFFNTPARRKFLKAEATEFDHVNRIVSRYALANPDVAVSLSHDGRETFSTTGQGDLEGAILAVYGREVAESMVEVDADCVRGYVSHPETTRSTRDYMATYVNGRYVTSGVLRESVLGAYGKQLASDRYPFTVLFLDLPPDAVDVNVHPRKLEVRFDDEPAVREAIRSATEDALLEAGLVRSSAPRGRSAPDEAPISPEPAEGDEGTAAASPGPDAEPGSPADAADAEVDGADDGRDTADAGGGGTAATADGDGPTAAAVGGDDADGGGETGGSAPVGGDAAPGRGPRDADRRFRAASQSTLEAGDADAEPAFDRLPPMRVLGQLHGTYVVAETDDGLVLIDQHAADERVNYERLRERLAGGPETQALAEPVRVELTAREAALFSEHVDALEAAGFRAERAGDRTVEVRGVPAAFGDALEPELLRDVLSECIGGADATSVDAQVDALLADLACYPSITGHTSLTEGSVRALLEALDCCENPYACPHGRPVVIEIDADELDERFERDYPGHGGRRHG